MKEQLESPVIVSVQCMAYNHEPYIRECLEGFVMQQTNFRFEAIVHDDASTDGTADIIREYAEKYPDIIKPIFETENQYSKHDGSIERIMNEACIGKYIALCEGDDYWTDPLKLQKQVDFLEEHEEYSMCCTAFSQTVNGNEMEKTEIVFDLDDIDIRRILEGQWIGTLTVMYRRDLTIDYKPPFPNLPMGDLPLWCHLAKKGKIKYFNEITANYRRLDTSACHFTDEVRQFGFNLDAMRVREYFAKQTDNMDVVRTVFSKNAHYMLDVCFSKGYFVPYLGKLWHFISCYGNPSGYDKLKYWGLKSKLNMQIAKMVYNIKKKK